MKTWVSPVIDEVNVSATAGGGTTPSTHDGNVYQLENGIYVEEYDPAQHNS